MINLVMKKIMIKFNSFYGFNSIYYVLVYAIKSIVFMQSRLK